MKNIGIIGLGNMGQVIAKNLLTQKGFKVFYYDKLKRNSSAALCCKDVQDLCSKVELLILAVKPQNFLELKPELIKFVTKKQCVISIMAGVSLKTIALGLNTKNIIRTMPNLALANQASLTGWKAGPGCSIRAQKNALAIIKHWGEAIACKQEAQLNSITAMAGSGPAYFMLLVDLIYQFAKSNNFSEAEALCIAKQVLCGTARYYQPSPSLPLEVITKITSKGGTTAAAFQVLKQKKVSENILKAMQQAKIRAKQLEK